MKELIEKATVEEIDFILNRRYPVCLAESLWHNADDLSSFIEDEFGNIRIYQYPTFCWEWMIDLDAYNVSPREKFNKRKICSDLHYYGARKIGKSKVALEMDIPMTMQYDKGGESLFSSIDEKHIKNITDGIKKIIDKHPWFKMFNPSVTDKQQTFRLNNNNYTMTIINMAVKSKDPGDSFFGKHTRRLHVEESSLEPEVVYQKRKDALSEYGAVMRCIAQGSKVLLANGEYVNIENVEIGDFVYAFDENTSQLIPSKVLNKMYNGKRETLTLSNKFSSVDLTPDHPVLITDDLGSAWVEAQEIIDGIHFDSNWVDADKNLKYANTKLYTDFNEQMQDVWDLEIEHHNFIANGFIVHNCSGMTNFTKHSPAGKAYNDKDMQKHLVNLPQYVNPTWDEYTKAKMMKEYNGETSIGYKVFVLGEVVEDGVSFLDMQRVRVNYKKDLPYKLIEIDKKKYDDFGGNVENFLHLSKSAGIKEYYLSADIGVTNITEIVIFGNTGEKYRECYNVILNGLSIDEKEKVFAYLITSMGIACAALDTNEGQGSGLADLLEKRFGQKKIFRFKGTMNIDYDFEKDDNGKPIYKNGKPVPREEKMAVFSVLRLQKLLYDNKFEIPEDDLKFDAQMNQVIAMVSKATGKVTYDCIAEENHYFDAWKIFATMEFKLSEMDCGSNRKGFLLGYNVKRS